MTTYDVFISYRRSDGSVIAATLAEYLRSKGLRVFFDKNEIKDSQDFKQHIEKSLRQAPNYLLIATTNAFKFYTDQEDWVKREMEIACENYDGNSGSNRVITVVVPQNAVVPREHDMPEKIQCLATPNRIILNGELPADDEKLRILKAVTQVNRHNLWNAGHRWLEDSKEAGGRFAALDINASLFPNAAKTEQKSRRRREFPIYVQREDDSPGNGNEKMALMQALSRDTDHVYLIGQGGSGKTTTLVHIMNEAYRKGQVYTETCQIPLYIALSTAPDTYGALYEGGKSTFIRRAIYKQVREDRTLKQIRKKELGKLDEAFSVPFDTAVQPIEDLLSKITPAPEYLLLLDGLNEVSRTYIEEADRSVIQMILQEINWLMEECPNVRIILTGRADEVMIQAEKLARFTLSGVEYDIIRQYLSSCECDQAKIDRVFENESLLETLRVPLFLVMYANLCENDEITTQGEILRTFFNESKKNLKIYTVQDRLSQVEEDIDNAASAKQMLRITAEMQCFMLDFLLPEIACYMEQRNLFVLDEEDIADIIKPVLTGAGDTDICGRYGKQIFDKYCVSGSAKAHTRKTAKDILAKLGSDMEGVNESFIDCCMFSLGILSANNRKYGFVHQHIRDYFAAIKYINHFYIAAHADSNSAREVAYQCLCWILWDKPINYSIRKFIGEILCEHKNKPQYIDGQWQYMVPVILCERSLIDRCIDIFRGMGDSEVKYCLYNLFQILKVSRIDLSGLDLHSLCLDRCELYDVRLSRCELRADLTGCLINRNIFFNTAHKGEVYKAIFTPDCQKIVTVSKPICSEIRIWDAHTLRCLHVIDKIGNECVIESVLAVSPDSKRIIFADGASSAWIYDINKKDFIGNINGNIISVEFSRTGKYILTGSSHNAVILWDSESLQPLIDFKSHTDYITSLCISPYENYVLTASKDNFIKMWNIATGECIATIVGHNDRINSVSFSPSQKHIISASDDKTIGIWNAATFERIKVIHLETKIKMVTYSPDGKQIIAACDDGSVLIFDGNDFKLDKKIICHSDTISTAYFSYDNKKIITASYDGSVRILDSSNYSYIGTISGHNSGIIEAEFDRACRTNITQK